MSNAKNYNSVAGYFDSMPNNTKQALLELKKCILEVAPTAEELINYNIPAYALKPGGKRDVQLMIAGFKNHVGFYPHPSTIEKFATELQTYTIGKGSVQFPLNEPMPKQLIIEMVKYRLSLLQS